MPSIPIDLSQITLNLIYDKLTFTLPINISERLNLINRINDPVFHQDYTGKFTKAKLVDIKTTISLRYTKVILSRFLFTLSTPSIIFFGLNITPTSLVEMAA